MIKSILVLLLIALGIIAAATFLKTGKSRLTGNIQPQQQTNQTELNYQVGDNNAMKIKSSIFSNNQKIPAKYTCDGENVNPSLTFEDIPDTAKSLVLIVDDPDAPTKVWTHWVLFNIPVTTTGINENSVPESATRGANDFKKNNYGGPCPPSGIHRYNFSLYALDTTLDLDEGSTKDEVINAINNHIISQDVLTGLYGK